MYTQRMFDMWSSVTSKLEAHANNLGQSNVQSPAGQNNSSGSIKGKALHNNAKEICIYIGISEKLLCILIYLFNLKAKLTYRE